MCDPVVSFLSSYIVNKITLELPLGNNLQGYASPLLLRATETLHKNAAVTTSLINL